MIKAADSEPCNPHIAFSCSVHNTPVPSTILNAASFDEMLLRVNETTAR